MIYRLIICLAVALLGISAASAQNYTATAGSGLTFGSKLVSTVQYPQIVMCDPTTPANCVGVNASGQVTVLGTGTFATQVNGFTSWAGGTLGAMANYGTSPGAVLVPGTNAFITNTPAVTQSGTWTVQPGNTANTTPWLVQGNVSNASSAVATSSINTPTISYNYAFNGTTWDQVSKTANGLKTDGSAVTQPVSVASGQIVDGGDTTLGTKADAAWSSGSGTLIAVTKTIANNTGAAIPAGTNVIGFVSNDPCSQATKLGAAINLTASGQVIAGTSAKKTYICSFNLVSATAQNIALVEGTGTTCATNIFGLAGGTTAATGWNLAANGGLAMAGGPGTVISPSADTNGTAANVCLLLSSTGQTSGQITYVQQ